MASAWDGYRDTLVASGNLTHAAICGITDGGVWAVSPGLNITQSEAVTLSRGFNDSSGLTSGIYIGGKKYMFIKGTSDEIMGRSGQTGVSIAKTNLCLLIGVYGDGMQPGAATLTMGKMQDYLKGNNY